MRHVMVVGSTKYGSLFSRLLPWGKFFSCFAAEGFHKAGDAGWEVHSTGNGFSSGRGLVSQAIHPIAQEKLFLRGGRQKFVRRADDGPQGRRHLQGHEQ